jgi:hypothetical protein
MTAEMVIMNRSAVAMAADSAVTITAPSSDGSRGVRKIYANANKLFELVRGRPVGMLIYDSADLVHVPWETLVKRYRTAHSQDSFGHLSEYAASFCSYLNREMPRLIPDDLRSNYLHYCVHKASRDFIEMAEKRIQDKVSEADGPSRINNSIRKATLDDLFDELEANISADQVASWANGLDEDQLFQKYGSESVTVVPENLQKLRLTITQKKRMCKIAYGYILRRGTTPSTTGIAIAGFGEDDTFPSMAHMYVGGIIDDKLVAYDHEEVSVSASNPSHLIALAQTTEASTFLFGIDPQVKDQITTFWKLWLSRLDSTVQSIVLKEFPGIEKDVLSKVSERIETYASESWNIFAHYMNKLHIDLRYGPIERSAAFLSKGELAGLAENLVDLASLRNRVSIDRAETVGGAIDVAVLSPGDGFVWIKRKHYFEMEFNPNWTGSQLKSVVGSRRASKEGADDV